MCKIRKKIVEDKEDVISYIFCHFIFAASALKTVFTIKI